MAKNKDAEIADRYEIPVQVLHEGLPARLRGAPDDEVRDGNLIRVATAAGLAAALALHPPGREPLQAYVVYYLPPAEAELIASMVENAKKKAPAEAGGAVHVTKPPSKAGGAVLVTKPPSEAGGAARVTTICAPQAEAGSAAAAAAAGASFVIMNERVLEAKVLALMAIRGDITQIDLIMKQVRMEKKAPFYVSDNPVVDHGLQAGRHLKPLKQAYFAARALAGHLNIAEAMLKCIDRPFYKSLLKSFPMTTIEKKKELLDLAAEYQELNSKHKSLSLSEIGQQILGLIAFLDFQDKKRLLTCADLVGISNDRSQLLKLLKKQRRKFRNCIDNQSLIGAEFIDFSRL